MPEQRNDPELRRLLELVARALVDAPQDVRVSEAEDGRSTVFELSVRPISEIDLWPADSFVAIEIEANGFLYNMVRNLTGTLVDVGSGRQSVNWPLDVLHSRDRRNAGRTAPPQGLVLVNVHYD